MAVTSCQKFKLSDALKRDHLLAAPTCYKIISPGGAARNSLKKKKQETEQEVGVKNPQGQELAHLCKIEFIVQHGVTISGFMTIPRRQIESKVKSLLLGSICNLAHHISSPILPWTCFHGVICICCRPQAETICMFCRQDHNLEARILCLSHPLSRILQP